MTLSMGLSIQKDIRSSSWCSRPSRSSCLLMSTCSSTTWDSAEGSWPPPPPPPSLRARAVGAVKNGSRANKGGSSSCAGAEVRSSGWCAVVARANPY